MSIERGYSLASLGTKIELVHSVGGDDPGLLHAITGSIRGHVPLMWPAALCSCLAAPSCGWAELWKILKRLKNKNKKKIKKKIKKFLAHWMWSLAICACKGCLSGLECLWVYWKGREPSWKTGIITQLSGKITVENWLFGLVGPTLFYASGNVCNLAPF